MVKVPKKLYKIIVLLLFVVCIFVIVQLNRCDKADIESSHQRAIKELQDENRVYTALIDSIDEERYKLKDERDSIKLVNMGLKNKIDSLKTKKISYVKIRSKYRDLPADTAINFISNIISKTGGR